MSTANNNETTENKPDRASASSLSVLGARVHNLKNIDVDIPHNSLAVITGLSGSGKSSLAFDTIFAEGQRRYIETFSAYARNMLGNLERPDVDKITGLSPVIAIEQKTVNRNPRSTIGTTTEVYDFLRLLYSRVGTAVSYVTGEPMIKYTRDQIVNLILQRYDGHKIYILAPLVKNRKGHYKELFEQLRKKGFLTVRVDGELRDLTLNMMLDRYKNHDIELVIDRLKVSAKDLTRLESTVADALRQGERQVMIYDVEDDSAAYFSQTLMDPASGISYREPAPHNFSFNSPLGACPCCKGLGYVNIVDRNKIIPNPSLSIHEGAILPLGKYKNSVIFWQIDAICKKYGCTIKTPVKDLPEEAVGEILNGTNERLVIENDTMATYNYFNTYEGLVKYIEMQQGDDASAAARKWSEGFFSRAECPECKGDRLNREALHFFIDGKNIAQLCRLDISDLYEWSKDVESRLSPTQAIIAREIMKEIRSRLKFLVDVGLDYLQLNRASATLSGGESQRIRLATQLGSQLVNVLYILDEPSIGLHQRDNRRLIDSLKQLRDASNSILVVEHDKDIMLDADYIVDIGPKAGRKGGEVVFAGTPAEMLSKDTLTANYLNGKLSIPLRDKPRKGNGQKLVLRGAKGNNLKDVTLTLPLGRFICVSGVSGSGKSSLINSTLQPILSQKFFRSQTAPLPYDKIEGIENIDKVVTVDQSPLGKSPRSNPATYTGVFTAIRDLYASLSEAKIRGYRPGRFSFNVAGGRCETCSGNGYKTIEMNFLPDVLVPCETCGGKRYNRETLEVRFKGKSIADVLDMTINQAVEFFAGIPAILNKIQVLRDIGLGYIKLGQPSSTLSGGENQRVKLATELSRRDTGKTLFILDEPTTGLHFDDIRVLLSVLNRLVDKGNTVLVIEHNLDVVCAADHVIDMGPGGGKNGGHIITTGTPAQVAKSDSPTAPFIREVLEGVQKDRSDSKP
ncbi:MULTISPECIES: excinuclease ABC subunit UvrA [Duncaniella]|jgi:excinuclease ABC subunit A|nr:MULTISPECIES: excinuclease ABC subunit UvrA [Duncaniella]ROS91052.1 excinuclease ABC subunit UvrA [Muribaculaceae bacterium Isolate-039 (Harlan)]ROS96974.1 excinuclease ABC subunit UvrA [Muribaculaceae bacterium Isolate-077 (Janvier)]ROS99222.1 excinuclease ABC subunit UvrA [Muribaculaceae bacterium Isolate-083 (Janvier)]ROT00910.1 excinuclease ABC subunit UvrA [Muribaculaceae bacterium Isolate-084 (Janvier)]QCD39977.1 excinuclease ABC subunit UvrA [Duncaniella sp. C9]